MAHLWVKDPPPIEYITHVLGRDVWHCPPDVARRQTADDFVKALTILAAESRVSEAENRR